jgi:uncharacterized protein YbaA (DUF1428 family)
MSLLGSGKTAEESNHVQLFVYKIPKKNHDRMFILLQKLTSVLRKHGTMYSEFYQLISKETFQAFANFGDIVSSAKDEEEVWLEIDHYRDFDHRSKVVASADEDPEAQPLFVELVSLVTKSNSLVMGEFKRLEV